MYANRYPVDDENEFREQVWMGLEIESMERVVLWDDENVFGERLWLGLEIESMEKVLRTGLLLHIEDIIVQDNIMRRTRS